MATAATVRVGGRGGAEKVVSLGGVGFSKTHKVGGESGGWTNPKANIGDVDYYKKWASSRNFSVGDTIVFEYNRQSDNVIVSRNRQDFESCRTKSLNRGASTTGSDSILLRFTGSHYFWSGFPGHCQAGQKFEILVREGYRPPRPHGCCDFEQCRYFPYARCSAYKHRCIYTQLYFIGPETSIFVSTEQLTFKNTDGSTIHVQDVVFGCGFSTNRNFKFSGIFGLGIGRSSLVSLLNSSFSYCIGSLQDPDYLHNKLILGDGAIIDEGDATPLQFIDGHYYITLEAISVDGRMLDINPNIFKMDDSGGGVMIDSGTDVTWLVKEAYEALRDEVMIRLEGEQMRSYSWPDKLCYHGIMSSDLKGFPTVRFHFRGGAKLALEKDSMFYQPRPDAFCMAVNPASINNRYVNFSLIGMMAQQFYNVGYDIGRKQKTFQRMDCEVLDDD
ncbi:hypothetical protein WN943_018805 [Citrus x changshan-huyou]